MMTRVSARSGAALLILAILTACGEPAGVPAGIPGRSESAADGYGRAGAWIPKAQSTFAVQYDGKLDLGVDADAFDVDGFDTSAATVRKLHAANRHAVCYIDVGTWEKWRPDAGKFPQSVLGKPDGGWPGERWLDIRQRSILEPIMRDRFQICKRKGFDAVDPDNIDGYQNDTGFPLTAAEQLAYDLWVAKAVHAVGMSAAQKNDGGQIGKLDQSFDFAVIEQCYIYRFCEKFAPYASADRLVVNIEYGMPRAKFVGKVCPQAEKNRQTALLKHLSLNAWVVVCPG